MKDIISWIVASKIKEGELENLKALREEMIISSSEESGTINFEWYISEDKKYCHIYECYENSDAAVLHLKNFGKNFASRFMSALEVKNFTVYGETSEELTKMMTPLGVMFMKTFGGFRK